MNQIVPSAPPARSPCTRLGPSQRMRRFLTAPFDVPSRSVVARRSLQKVRLQHVTEYRIKSPQILELSPSRTGTRYSIMSMFPRAQVGFRAFLPNAPLPTTPLLSTYKGTLVLRSRHRRRKTTRVEGISSHGHSPFGTRASLLRVSLK
jgi:hypothetical protein